MFKSLGAQLRQPSGIFGRMVSKMMDKRNKESYEHIILELDLESNNSILEIGYGPGQGISMIVNKVPDCIIHGLDFSELMFKKASQRNRKAIMNGKVKLNFGELTNYDFGLESYDKIFCLNVIYFWSDLNKVFLKIHSLLNNDGAFWIYMTHKEEIEKLKFTEKFCKYSIDEVVDELKNTGFSSVEYKLDYGYYIKAVK